MPDEQVKPQIPTIPAVVPTLQPVANPAPIAPGAPATIPVSTLPLPEVKTSTKKHHEPKDNPREIIETIVFVIVLVLMLKTFVAEAFVIPTGSMASTLLGYHKEITCPKCGYSFSVNASCEVENGIRVTGCTCPNCRYHIEFHHPQQQFPGAVP